MIAPADTARTVVLASDVVRASIDVGRGAHLYELALLESGVNVLYEDPRGVEKHVVGGWYELFPNAGPGSVIDGRAIAPHGDVRDAPWQVLGSGDTWAEFAVESADLPLRLVRRMELVDSKLRITETVTNVGHEPVSYLWGHHITLGEAFVADSRIEVASSDIVGLDRFTKPASAVQPDAPPASLDRLPGRSGGTVDFTRFPPAPAAEMLFARTVDAASVAVEGAGIRLEIEWDEQAFPALWVWIENRGTPDEPFNGEAVGLALEPQAAYIPSLGAALEAGLAPSLAPGATATAWLTATLAPSK